MVASFGVTEDRNLSYRVGGDPFARQWRLSSVATEDRNMSPVTVMQACGDVAVVLWRRPRIATPSGAPPRTRSTAWRSSSEVAEDRNVDSFIGGDS